MFKNKRKKWSLSYSEDSLIGFDGEQVFITNGQGEEVHLSNEQVYYLFLMLRGLLDIEE